MRVLSLITCLSLGLAAAAAAQERVRQEEVDRRDREPPRETFVPEEGVSVPMERWGPRPIVSVSINGAGPHRFIIDTGSSLSVIIDRSISEDVGIGAGEPHEIAGMKGELVELDKIEIGPVVLSGVHAVVNDIAKFMPGQDAPVGILGIGLFADCLLSFDYPRSAFLFEAGELPESGETIVPYRYVGAIEFDVELAGLTVPVHLDTGSHGFLMLTNSFEPKLPLRGEPTPAGRVQTPMGGADMREATLDGTLRFAGFEYEDPPVRFADLPQMTRSQVGNIGSGLLERFAVTFDQRGQRLRFTPAAPDENGSGG